MAFWLLSLYLVNETALESVAPALKPAVPKMVRVPAGTFYMGSQAGESGREGDEAPRHKVKLAHSFEVSTYEVTEREWNACVDARACHPLKHAYGPDFPATDMYWKDAKGYAVWLSKATGSSYRLLTEAEWEYVARAGTDTTYFQGKYLTARDANFAASRTDGPVPVGRYRANPFGVFDTEGNVWEWVQDCYTESGYYTASPDGDAISTLDCQMHVLRGGAFDTRPDQVRVGYRFRAQFGGANVGFRLAKDLAQ